MSSTGPIGSMPYEVRLSAFEGPLDLLLHLIEESELDIYDIPISQITAQYLDYLHASSSLDLELATEFLVMAATLMLIKARTLVPRPPPDVRDGIAEDDEVDPREELINRLLEYRRFKEAAKDLAGLEESASLLLSREASVPVVSRGEMPLPGNLSVGDLFEAFQRVMASQKGNTEPFRRVPTDEIHVGAAMKGIVARLARDGRVAFHELFDGSATRSDLIACFLGLLELVRLCKVSVHQGTPLSTIELRLRETRADDIEGSPGPS